MQSPDTVKIDVNKAALLGNIRSIFTSPRNIITELLQNSRRAGATYVKITTSLVGLDDADIARQQIVIEDDGCGVSDFAALLTLGNSRWSEETLLTEQPFGMGFFAAICHADRVAVVSNGQRVCFDTSAAMAGKEIEIERGETERGTAVTLVMGTHVFGGRLAEIVEHAASGFPLEVLLNSAKTRRHWKLTDEYDYYDGVHALFETKDPKNGHMGILGVHGGTSRMFLCGLPISENQRLVGGCVHLDASFQARMPDRDVLLNSDAQVARIRTAIIHMLKVRIDKAVANGNYKMVFGPLLRTAYILSRMDLLDNVPVIPSDYIAYATGVYASQPGESSAPNMETTSLYAEEYRQARYLTEEDVRALGQGFRWYDIANISPEEGGPANAKFLHAARVPIYMQHLSDDHWFTKLACTEFDDPLVEVSVPPECVIVSADRVAGDNSIVVASRVDLHCKALGVTVHLTVDLYDGDTYYITSEDVDTGALLLQQDSYEQDGGNFVNSGALEEAVASFDCILAALRNTPMTEILGRLLVDSMTSSALKMLSDKSAAFHVKFSNGAVLVKDAKGQ